mgnify:CR=1 FL=1
MQTAAASVSVRGVEKTVQNLELPDGRTYSSTFSDGEFTGAVVFKSGNQNEYVNSQLTRGVDTAVVKEATSVRAREVAMLHGGAAAVNPATVTCQTNVVTIERQGDNTQYTVAELRLMF